jgi:hypothetical protein
MKVLNLQIEDLREERDRLLAIIESQGDQIKALMPGPQERGNGEPSKTSHVQDGHKLSRWQALRFVLLGR